MEVLDTGKAKHAKDQVLERVYAVKFLQRNKPIPYCINSYYALISHLIPTSLNQLVSFVTNL